MDHVSRGPTGIDPNGECPANPKNGVKLEGDADYDVVVERRIRALSSQASRALELAERLDKIKKTPKAKLFERVEALEAELVRKNEVLESVKSALAR